MKTLTTPHLIIKPSIIHGYGVFANKQFEPNEIIEECYAIFSTGEDIKLNNYYFQSKSLQHIIIPTGFGLIYNHADIPNAAYYLDELNALLVFKALRFIHKHEEIKIFYGKAWFSERKMAVKKIAYWRKLVRFLSGIPLRTSLILGVLLLANQWLHVLAVK